ncbi:hypothetical protein PIB30_022751 [Stylosanthes scabra]|uniref:Uncharacterized protein n=1 Tax=Stylosanthes scabra TaxID=79078 RepID=A0ABU6Q905_9FABA|nr:hypothetical protein [Stylosanthes scabra]
MPLPSLTVNVIVVVDERAAVAEKRERDGGRVVMSKILTESQTSTGKCTGSYQVIKKERRNLNLKLGLEISGSGWALVP